MTGLGSSETFEESAIEPITTVDVSGHIIGERMTKVPLSEVHNY